MKTLIFIAGLVAAGAGFGQTGAAYHACGKNLANPAAQISLSNNPAFTDKARKAFQVWGANRFTGTTLIDGGLNAHITKGNSAIGLQAHYSGTTYFNGTKLQFSLAKKFNERFQTGVSMGIQSITQFESSQKNYIPIAKFGVHALITSKIQLGVVICNPWILETPVLKQYPRADISLSYKLSHQTHIYPQFSTQLNDNNVYGLALSHNIENKIQLLAAVQTGYEPISLGIQLKRKSNHFTFATCLHRTLGFTSSFTLNFFVL